MGSAAAIVGGSMVSGLLGGKATKDAANTTAAATDRATQTNMAMFREGQRVLAPWREFGESFMGDMRNFIRGNYDGYLNSPDFKFAMEQGEQAINRKASAAGSRYGGRALKEAVQFAEGTASQFTDNYFNKLFNVLNIGANAAASTAQGAMQTGQTNASLIAQGGANQANLQYQGGINMANSITSGINNYTTLQMYNDMMNKTA